MSVSAFCSLCGCWRGELGQEPTPGLFIEHIVSIFREVRRVLKKTGVCFVNMSDSYAGSWGAQGGPSNLNLPPDSVYPAKSPGRKGGGLKPKDRCLIPERFAIAMQEDGWWVRDQIVWAKPNPMPSSVRDRTTPAHEMLYVFTKARRYFWDKEAVDEPCIGSVGATIKVPDGWDTGEGAHGTIHREGRSQGGYVARGSGNKERKYDINALHPHVGRGVPYEPNEAQTRNARSVWIIPTQSRGEDHFASYPDELVRRCLAAGCQPDGVVLDPFLGRGTTLVVAKRLGISGIGIELNGEYAALARRNIADAQAPLMELA